MNPIIRENFPRVRKAVKNGTTYWICDARSKKLYPDGTQEWFSTQAEAISRHNEIREQLETGNVVSPVELAFFREWKTKYASLPDMDRERVIPEMEKALKNFWNNWQRRDEEKEEIPKISELCDEWVSVKVRGDYKKLRESTIKEIKSTSKLIASLWGHKQYSSLSKEDIREYLESLQDAHTTTKRKWRVRIGGFCQWCIDAGRSGKTRTNPARGIKTPSTNRDIPVALKPEEAKKLLDTCEDDPRFTPMINFIAIGLFAGLRPQEIQRLTRENITLEKEPFTTERYKNFGKICGIIDVRASVAKVGKPRKVNISETLAAYLTRYKDQPIYPKVNFRKTFDSLRANAGFEKWEPNIIRHTAASYFVSKTQDWALTASQFGNSVAVLEKYYVDTTHPREVEKYYSIRPKTTGYL